MTSVKHQDYLPADVADLCEKLCAASLQARPGGIRDSLRRGAGQGAVRLLRFATALRVTAPLGYGSRRLV